MRRMFRSVLFHAVLFACAFITLAAGRVHAVDTPAGSEPARTDLPVRMIVLFSSGVGYFEHSGTVQGTTSAELRFKSEQINDILKSLVLEDLDGGKIGTIAYPSRDPIEKTLRGFQVDITSNPSFGELLNQLRGPRFLLRFTRNRSRVRSWGWRSAGKLCWGKPIKQWMSGCST